MRIYSLLFIYVLVYSTAFSQDSIGHILPDTLGIEKLIDGKTIKVSDDSTKIQQRSFDESALRNLRNDEDLNYKEPPTVVESIWDRFWAWVSEIFEYIFKSAAKTNWSRALLYTLAIVVMVIIIMLLLKVDAFRVFYSGSDNGVLKYDGIDENIHEMNFDALIKEALEKKQYRLGVRLTFLNALKILSDKQQVDWRPGKTNLDYIKELKEPALKTGFNELSFYFEYAWYGDFNVNESMFLRVKGIFENWRKVVG